MKNNTNTDYFQNTHKVAQNDIQDSYYKISTTLNNLKKEILQQIVLGININNNFYNNVHNITDKLQQRKFKHKFASSSLTTKPLTIRLRKSLIILKLLKHCSIIYKRKKVSLPSHIEEIKL